MHYAVITAKKNCLPEDNDLAYFTDSPRANRKVWHKLQP